MRPDVLMRAVGDALLLHGRRGPFGDEQLCRAIVRSVAEVAAWHGPVPTPTAVEVHLGRLDRNQRIRRLHVRGAGTGVIARRFNLSSKQVSRILGH